MPNRVDILYQNDKISENKIKRMNLKSIYKILNDYSISHNKKVKNELILLITDFIKKNFLNYVTPLKKQMMLI